MIKNRIKSSILAKKIIAIESSCDNSCISIMNSDRTVEFSWNVNQEQFLKEDRGYIPIMLSERHITAFESVVSKLKNILQDIDAVIVTTGPGLVFSLLIGASFARAIAIRMNIQCFYANHIEAHILSPLLVYPESYPFIVVIATGGHFYIVLVRKEKGKLNYIKLSESVDDAPGEVFDKFARAADLDQYTGAAVERIALNGRLIKELINQKVRMRHSRDQDNLSFSGIKTAFIRALESKKYSIPDIAISLQHVIGKIIVDKLSTLVKKYCIPTVYLAGGVGANLYIREMFRSSAQTNAYVFHTLPISLCTDNAEMIANLFWIYNHMNAIHLLQEDKIFSTIPHSFWSSCKKSKI